VCHALRFKHRTAAAADRRRPNRTAVNPLRSAPNVGGAGLLGGSYHWLYASTCVTARGSLLEWAGSQRRDAWNLQGRKDTHARTPSPSRARGQLWSEHALSGRFVPVSVSAAGAVVAVARLRTGRRPATASRHPPVNELSPG